MEEDPRYSVVKLKLRIFEWSHRLFIRHLNNTYTVWKLINYTIKADF